MELLDTLDALDAHCQKYNIKATSHSSILFSENGKDRTRRLAVYMPENVHYWNKIDDMWQKTIIENNKRTNKNLLINK